MHGIRLIPQRENGQLHGFALAGRYPDTTSEWMMTLVSMLHQVATNAHLPRSTLYHTLEIEQPHTAVEDVIAMVEPLAEIGKPVEDYQPVLLPLALLVLHPVGAVPTPELEEPGAHPVASGALLLPGMPDLGLDHRAAWAAVDTTGSVQRMSFTTHATLTETIDLAVLATLIDQ